MSVLITTNFQLKQLITSINTSIHDNPYNLTDTQIQSLQNYLNSLLGLNFSEPFLDKAPSHCGSVLRNYAANYAKNYHPIFAILVCLFGCFANLLNVVVLTRRDMICAPINRILTALAVADVLIMVEYVPYAYYYYLVLPKNLDFSFAGAVYVLVHAHLTQVLHTTSICLTLTLAVWRYLVLRYPEKNQLLCSDSRCTLGITLSYILPIILCIPTYVTITITSQEVTENHTTYVLYHTDLHEMFKSDKTLLKINFWIYAVLLKLLPCGILTAITSWLIRTLFNAKRRKEVLQSYDCHALVEKDAKKRHSKTERRADRTTRMLVAVLVLFLVTEFPQGIFALLIGIKGKDLFLECYQLYGEIMDILALINGAISFILYCSMNRMFRATFGKVVKRRILAKVTSPTSELHTTVMYGSRTSSRQN